MQVPEHEMGLEWLVVADVNAKKESEVTQIDFKVIWWLELREAFQLCDKLIQTCNQTHLN